jgi:uncharacterized protein (UPF0332 family)
MGGDRAGHHPLGDLTPELQRLIEEGKITPFKVPSGAVSGEINGATYDLERATRSLGDGDAKWATIQAYYSMFHAARALLLAAGYREKSHRALLTAIDELYVKTHRLERRHHANLRTAISLREEAEYDITFTEASAKRLIEYASYFLEATRKIL